MGEYVRLLNEYDKKNSNSKDIPTVFMGPKLMTGSFSDAEPVLSKPSQSSQGTDAGLCNKPRTELDNSDAFGSLNPRGEGQGGGLSSSISRDLNDGGLFKPAERENIISSLENEGVGFHYQRDVIVSTVNQFQCINECGSEGVVTTSHRLEIIDSILPTEALGTQDMIGCVGEAPNIPDIS
ncbi:hypothetical protein C5167_031525 [Papaver somniferum]|uniref:Uncharacterized protein n=1 Tax=Papaver somniferum TaxID=3469 RepID=A0A4Y7K606_PAPSO|nr:hypothetical protein C5167_031525 [Papaver somniferum]